MKAQGHSSAPWKDRERAAGSMIQGNKNRGRMGNKKELGSEVKRGRKWTGVMDEIVEFRSEAAEPQGRQRAEELMLIPSSQWGWFQSLGWAEPGVEVKGLLLERAAHPRSHIHHRTVESTSAEFLLQIIPGVWDGKESACNAGDLGLIPGSGISPGGGHGNPLQYSCLENSMGRGAWRATVHGVAELDPIEWLALWTLS